jgi:sirohydrochlorin ferrochelatase
MRSPSANAMARAIADDLAGRALRYPDRVAFIDADEPRAGREIAVAIDRGYVVVLASADGREHILTAQALGCPSCCP